MAALTLADVRRRVKSNLAGEMGDEDIDTEINMAIEFAETDGLYIPVADESLSQADDTYEYNLTGGELGNIKYIRDIFLESSDSGLFYDVPLGKAYWTIEEAGTPFLRFSKAWTPEDAKLFRIKGYKPQAVVDEDTDEIELPAAYIVWKSLAFCHGVLSSGAASSRAAWHERRIALTEQYAEVARYSANEHKVGPHSRLVKGRI